MKETKSARFAREFSEPHCVEERASLFALAELYCRVAGGDVGELECSGSGGWFRVGLRVGTEYLTVRFPPDPLSALTFLIAELLERVGKAVPEIKHPMQRRRYAVSARASAATVLHAHARSLEDAQRGHAEATARLATREAELAAVQEELAGAVAALPDAKQALAQRYLAVVAENEGRA